MYETWMCSVALTPAPSRMRERGDQRGRLWHTPFTMGVSCFALSRFVFFGGFRVFRDPQAPHTARATPSLGVQTWMIVSRPLWAL